MSSSGPEQWEEVKRQRLIFVPSNRAASRESAGSNVTTVLIQLSEWSGERLSSNGIKSIADTIRLLPHMSRHGVYRNCI